MPIEIRRFEGDTRSWADTAWLAFGGRFHEGDLPVFEAAHEPDRSLAAYDGTRAVGTAGIFSFSLTVPARAAGCRRDDRRRTGRPAATKVF
jgi:hypothetical protein